MFAAPPSGKSQRHTGCLVGWNVINAFAIPVRPGQGQLNSMARCTGAIADLDRKRHLLTCKRWLRGFGCYPYAHEIDQSVRNRNRSEEHTSELQSQSNLVCRLLLETTN